MRWIYSLRCRTLPLKCNAPSQFSDRQCLAPGCQGEDRNEHIYKCQFLAEKGQLAENIIEFAEIFSSDVKKQQLVVNLFRKQYDKRHEFLSSHTREDPEAPQDISYPLGAGRRANQKGSNQQNKLR